MGCAYSAQLLLDQLCFAPSDFKCWTNRQQFSNFGKFYNDSDVWLFLEKSEQLALMGVGDREVTDNFFPLWGWH